LHACGIPRRARRWPGMRFSTSFTQLERSCSRTRVAT
jgi:hypothetical protein